MVQVGIGKCGEGNTMRNKLHGKVGWYGMEGGNDCVGNSLGEGDLS